MIDDDEEPNQEDIDAAMLLDERVWNDVIPVLDAIDDDHPGQSSYFVMFINCIHVLLHGGWTKEELLDEVDQHHAIFLESDRGDGGLH